MPQVVNSCGRCGKEVFCAEKNVAINKVWHKLCFSCVKCNKLLCPSNFCTFKNEIYCRQCYKKHSHYDFELRSGNQSDDSFVCPPSCKGRRPCRNSAIEETKNLKPSEIKQIIKSKLKSLVQNIDENIVQKFKPGSKNSVCCLDSECCTGQKEVLFVSDSGTTKIVKITAPKVENSSRNNMSGPEMITKPRNSRHISFCNDGHNCPKQKISCKCQNINASKHSDCMDLNNIKICKDNCTNTCSECNFEKCRKKNKDSEVMTQEMSNRSDSGSNKSNIKDNNYKNDESVKNNQNSDKRRSSNTSYNVFHSQLASHSSPNKSAGNSKHAALIQSLNHFQATPVHKTDRNSLKQTKQDTYIPPKYNSKEIQREKSHFLENFEKPKTEYASINDYKSEIPYKKDSLNDTESIYPTRKTVETQYSKSKQIIDETQYHSLDKTTDKKLSKKLEKLSKQEEQLNKKQEKLEKHKKSLRLTKEKIEEKIETEAKEEKEESLLGKLFFFPTCHRRKKLEAQKKKRMNSGQCRINKKLSYYEQKCVVTAEVCPRKRYIRNSRRKLTENNNKKTVEQTQNKKQFDRQAAGDSNQLKKEANASIVSEGLQDKRKLIKTEKYSPIPKKLKPETCNRCNEKVYIMERRVTENGVFHENCFTCFFCNKYLHSLNLVPKMDEILCKQCYHKYYGPELYGFGVQQNVYYYK